MGRIDAGDGSFAPYGRSSSGPPGRAKLEFVSDDELRLNRLHRYKKTSPRLALEVHSHCEVPAGCGGVVLRWRDADGPASISASFYVAGAEPKYTLDGDDFDAKRASVSPGRHVLAFEVSVAAPREGFVVGAVSLSPPISTALFPAFGTTQTAAWSAALAGPGDEGWRLPSFDGAGFAPLGPKPMRKPKGRDSFRFDYLTKDHASLGLPAALSGSKGPVAVRVRAVFSVTPRGLEA